MPTSQLINALQSQSNLFTREQAAAYLGITTSTLAVWACTGRYSLPYVKIGRLVKYRKADLEAFVERRTKKGVLEEDTL